MSSERSDDRPPGAPGATMELIDPGVLSAFPVDSFRSTRPFPWSSGSFLTDDGFRTLCEDFPSLSLFEKHVDLERPYGQRPHNRYYLAYETSIYEWDREASAGAGAVPGIARHEDLAPSWQAFFDELRSPAYQELIARCVGTTKLNARFAWHVGEGGSEVSAHVDTPEKAATHIFYFNPEGAWEPAWGGSTLVLGGKQAEGMNPEFDDFAEVTPVEICGNSSFLFKNTPDAWHGVRALTSPEGKQRRLFNVIFEHAEPRVPTPVDRARSKLGAARRSLGRRFGARLGNRLGGRADVV